MNTLNHEFTVDDPGVISKNTIVQKGPSAIGEIMTTPYRQGYSKRKESLYRPLSLIVFALEWSISPNNPGLGHLINILFYMLTALILYKTLNLMFKEMHPLIPFFTTLLFVAHPLHTEVVANIKSLDEILGFLFSILGLYFYMIYSEKNNFAALVLGCVSIFLATLSKEIAVTMVAIVPITLWFFKKPGRSQIILATASAALAVGAYMALRVQALGDISNFDPISITNNSLAMNELYSSGHMATAFKMMGKYLWMHIIPYPLSRDYSYNTIPNTDFSDLYAILSLLVILALLYFSIKNFRKKDKVAYGILFFAATIALVSNILFLIEATFAERFTYTPSLGFCIVAVILITKLSTPSKTPLSGFFPLIQSGGKASLILILVISIFSAQTIARNADWKSDLTLYRADLQTCPESARLHGHLGNYLGYQLAPNEQDPELKKQYLQEAVQELETAVQIMPAYADAWVALGNLYSEEFKEYAKALECFRNARTSKTEAEPEYHNFLGIAFGQLKQYDSAFKEFNKAIELNPKDFNAHNNLGNYKVAVNLYDEALQHFTKAIALNPNSEMVAYNFGNYYVAVKDYQNAIKWFKKASEIKPDYESAILHIGNCYGMLKDFENSLYYLKKAYEINPKNSQTANNLKLTYKFLGDTLNANKIK